MQTIDLLEKITGRSSATSRQLLLRLRIKISFKPILIRLHPAIYARLARDDGATATTCLPPAFPCISFFDLCVPILVDKVRINHRPWMRGLPGWRVALSYRITTITVVVTSSTATAAAAVRVRRWHGVGGASALWRERWPFGWAAGRSLCFFIGIKLTALPQL